MSKLAKKLHARWKVSALGAAIILEKLGGSEQAGRPEGFGGALAASSRALLKGYKGFSGG
eukprot:1140653-Pelagomonas_calceolata.AAC.2